MKVSVNGKQHEIGAPAQLSAKLLEIVQASQTPLEAMAALEMAKIGLERIYRDVMIGQGQDLEDIEKTLAEGWEQGKKVAEALYQTVRS